MDEYEGFRINSTGDGMNALMYGDGRSSYDISNHGHGCGENALITGDGFGGMNDFNNYFIYMRIYR